MRAASASIAIRGYTAVDMPVRCYACASPVVCEICETCALHCLTPGGPDACWEEVDRYRREHVPDSEPPEKPRWPAKN